MPLTLLAQTNAIVIPLPDKRVQCVVTSPPYYGLRDYDLPPTDWPTVTYSPMPGLEPITIAGCDSKCQHEWVGFVTKRGAGGERMYGSSDNAVRRGPAVKLPLSSFCRKCGSWRGCLGLEPSLRMYVAHLVLIFREIRRVLRDDGTIWLNLGDSYTDSSLSSRPSNPGLTGAHDLNPRRRLPSNALKPKDLCGIPWRVAFALQADGWWLRSDIIWAKPNGMPESVTDRPTTAHEHIFLLTKSKRYYYDADAIKEPAKVTTVTRAQSGTWHNTEERLDVGFPGQSQRNKAAINRDLRARILSGAPVLVNKRNVWTIGTQPYSGAHFAVFPPALVEPCIKAGTSEHGCCPQCGAPWERVVEKEFIPQQDVSVERGIKGAEGTKPSTSWDGVPRGCNRVTTTGWRPTCHCDGSDPVPCLVLDPFAGSGTTLLVARKLRRSSIGLDLSGAYLRKQARERLDWQALAEWEQGHEGTPEPHLAALPLFTQIAKTEAQEMPGG